MDKKLVVLNVDDWEALYADGELVEEGHSIRWVDALRSLGVDVEWHEVTSWFEENDLMSFPSEIPEFEID